MHVQSVQKYCFSLSNMQIRGLLLPSSSWLLKLPNNYQTLWMDYIRKQIYIFFKQQTIKFLPMLNCLCSRGIMSGEFQFKHSSCPRCWEYRWTKLGELITKWDGESMSSPNFIRSSGSSTADTNESAELILDLGLIKRDLKFKLKREQKNWACLNTNARGTGSLPAKF